MARQLAPWAEHVLALAEELKMPDIHTTSKREWTARAKAALATKHSAHWHAGLAVLQAVDFGKSQMGQVAARCVPSISPCPPWTRLGRPQHALNTL